ncbi:hypothetical protein GT694_00885 [Blautia massiliensis]|uniref:Type I restriction modification DNA specificity domain-containing protein n=2 Tax=Blautia TaxID=572511 RepID=A0A6L8TAK8_9FIRM|nr:restriction endonuclease subunit S [Blautia massiliensis (ex Durand et al. 2017)]MZL60627.1 hypothetical protein [Blautia massiliensis (ex Durand et al. 2017)]
MEKCKLGDICEIVSGSTPKTTIEEYWDGDVKWITPAELNENVYIINDSVRKITKLAVEKTGLSSFPEGTVILSTRAPIGKVAIAGCEMYCNQGFKNLICSEKIFNKYLYWFLKGNTMFLNSLGRGATFKEISKAIVSEIEINVPEIEEQHEIVKILEKVNTIIRFRKQELSVLDTLVKARFVELFVGKKYEIVKAGSIIKEMRNGVSPSTSGGHFEKVLTLSAITQGKFDDKAWKEGFFTDCPSAEKRITEDDFYICRGNGNKSLVGMGVYALENRPDLVFPDTVIAAHIDTERMVLPYLWIMWQQPEVRKQLESGARTTNGTYKINQKVISEIKIICPPINEQEVFADFVKQVNKSKVINQLLQKWNYMYHVTIEKVK